MVKFSSSFFILLCSVLVAASAVPLAGVKRESDSPALVAREPEYPLYLAKREATGRKTRHVRPDYGAMNNERDIALPEMEATSRKARHVRPDYGAMNEKRDITLPDVGQVVTFPPTGIPQPIRGPWGDSRISASNGEIDRQNPDYVAPPLSDKGLFAHRLIFSIVLTVFCRRCSQFEVVFLFVAHSPAGRWLGS